MTEESSHEKNSEEKNVLLEEYQACIRNRNHYDTIIWVIGSIFLAASLTLFGLSFDKDILFWDVLLMAFFSSMLMYIWFLYVKHVNPYVMRSIIRLHEIELELAKKGSNVRLNYEIYKNTEKQKRGFLIFNGIFVLLFLAWLFRLILVYKDSETSTLLESAIIFCVLIFFVLIILQYGLLKSQSSKYRERMNQIVEERDKLEEKKKKAVSHE